MDIFQNKDGFFGKPNFASIQNYTREFWNLANKLKSELGDKGYYMDIYLNIMFEALANIDLNTASFVADTICSNIISDCRIFLGVTPDHKKSEFFELVKNTLKSTLWTLKEIIPKRNFMPETSYLKILSCCMMNLRNNTKPKR